MNDLMPAGVRFAPRRLCHVNLFVGDLERSVAFYERVCGIELVRRETAIAAGFLSNGNSHHDVGLMQSGMGLRVGRGGHVQVSSGRGQAAGLNHLGWEMDTEADLVAAWKRAVAAGIEIHRTSDHQLAHSVYLFDPDGNLHEFYADTVDDWRQIFNPGLDDLVTADWDPRAGPPSAKRHWPDRPAMRHVPGAPFRPRRLARVALVARDFAGMNRFLTEVAGLVPVGAEPDVTLYRGAAAAGGWDLALFRERERLRPGLHHFVFQCEAGPPGADPQALQKLAPQSLQFDRGGERSLFLPDPDGLWIEFRGPGVPAAAGSPAASLPFPFRF